MAKRSPNSSVDKDKLVSSLKKPPTLSQVAELAGVSRWAAGAVLNKGLGNTGCSEENRKRILEAAKTLSYQPNHAARTLRGKNSQIFGVMVASAGDPLRSFLVEFLDAESSTIGCQVLIGNTVGNPMVGSNRFEQCVVDFAQRKVDGVLCAVNPWWEGDRRFLLDTHPNTVFYDDPGIPDACCVTVDRADAVRQAVDYLVRQGRKRIAVTLMSRDRKTQMTRLAAYRDALKANRHPFRSNLVFFGCDHDAKYPKFDTVEKKWSLEPAALEKAIILLVDRSGADAIIAYDDFWAATFVNLFRKQGRNVPRDIAVVGYLNHYLADWTDPPLTTIDVNHASAAKQMIKLLEEMVGNTSGKTLQKTILIKPQLVIRESA